MPEVSALITVISAAVLMYPRQSGHLAPLGNRTTKDHAQEAACEGEAWTGPRATNASVVQTFVRGSIRFCSVPESYPRISLTGTWVLAEPGLRFQFRRNNVAKPEQAPKKSGREPGLGEDAPALLPLYEMPDNGAVPHNNAVRERELAKGPRGKSK